MIVDLIVLGSMLLITAAALLALVHPVLLWRMLVRVRRGTDPPPEPSDSWIARSQQLGLIVLVIALLNLLAWAGILG